LGRFFPLASAHLFPPGIDHRAHRFEPAWPPALYVCGRP
jgi:hypothetical protein